jgi:hypothetical protein
MLGSEAYVSLTQHREAYAKLTKRRTIPLALDGKKNRASRLRQILCTWVRSADTFNQGEH